MGEERCRQRPIGDRPRRGRDPGISKKLQRGQLSSGEGRSRVERGGGREWTGVNGENLKCAH